MPNFQIAIERPEEITPRLGKPELHWKKGRSAFELSTAWMQAAGFPPSVRAVIDQAPEWRGTELLEAFFQRETVLPGRGRPSQTDLLAIVRLKNGNAILGVEVDEPFGPRVNDWIADAKDQNRKHRLTGLCSTLDLNSELETVGSLFYQLLHRACAAIYEAKRFRYKRAIIIVHSFAEKPAPPHYACVLQ